MAQDVTSHRIKLALGGMRFDRDIEVGWDFSPSIGLVARDIELMGLSLQDFKEPLTKAIRDVMIPSIRRNFTAQGRPEKWPPLEEFTLQQKAKAGAAGAKILVRSGALKEGATQFSLWHFNSSNTSIAITGLPDDIWYGALHQGGYGGMGAYITKARKKLGAKASEGAVRTLAQRLLDLKLLAIEKGKGGKVAGGAGIPQRRFILFQEDDIDDIYEIFYEWLVEQTIKVGRFSR